MSNYTVKLLGIVGLLCSIFLLGGEAQIILAVISILVILLG